MRCLNKDHGKVLQLFYDYPKGYIIEWFRSVEHGTFLLNEGAWFFNFNETVISSDRVLVSTICKDLAAEDIITTDLKDKEWHAQVALGTKQYRTYHMSPNMKTILKKEFIEYLDKAPIIWV